jgi:hypothetical protein
MKKRASFFIVILLFILISSNFAGELEDPFDKALKAVGLTKETLKFDYYDMSNFGGNEFLLPLFTLYHQNFFKIPYYTSNFKNYLASNSRSLKNLIGFASLRVDEGVGRGFVGNPLEENLKKIKSKDALYESIDSLFIKMGRKFSSGEAKKLKNMTLEVPEEISQQVALLIYASLDALKWRNIALEKAEKKFNMQKIFDQSTRLLSSDEDLATPEFYDFLHYVDYKYLYTGAEDLAGAVDFVKDSLNNFSSGKKFNFSYNTPLGRIIISNGTDDNYPEADYFILIDLSGDDSYESGGANRSYSYPISILIDKSGDDKYLSTNKTKPSFGAGAFGYGFLVDLKGKDEYQAVNLSQGAGCFGVGVLMDYEGDETYESYTTSQGLGQFGIGILSDLEGNDTYNTFLDSQGFGYTKKIGILLDSKGKDEYTANDTQIDFPSAQTKEHNDSQSQGVGYGRRADFLDGHSWAGGIGMLVDLEGDDQYSAGLFAQGCAFWYALGILWDEKGNDGYNGVWYVQGSGAHFGCGVLYDAGGNDHYRASMNMAIGAGHDFTLGVLIDESGNDIYDAPNLSLGGGNDNGIGIFWDKSGNDTYNVSAQTTLGRANITSRGTIRDYMLCLGLFLDTGGKDTYSKPFAKDNALWTQKGLNTEKPLEAEKGVGLDGEYK